VPPEVVGVRLAEDELVQYGPFSPVKLALGNALTVTG
jgi:hypothetical protein